MNLDDVALSPGPIRATDGRRAYAQLVGLGDALLSMQLKKGTTNRGEFEHTTRSASCQKARRQTTIAPTTRKYKEAKRQPGHVDKRTAEAETG